MKRNLQAMSQKYYDLVIAGGGISGAAIARDAALRGFSVALVEKKDFAHATTAGSSKLIHGGLRYLVNGELGLVRESLRERRIWETIAPHMVHPLPFLIPTYGYGMRGGPVLSMGLALYDLLAFDRNRLDDEDKKLPGFRSLGREEALAMMPYLNREGLTGAKVYYDCQMLAPERLCLEMIQSAVEQGADVANYAEVTGFIHQPGEKNTTCIQGVQIRDALNGQPFEIRGQLTVNASGPWADTLMTMAEKDEHPARTLIRSKGIHLITRPLTDTMALAVQPPEGGHFFLLPWRSHTIIGTTDTVFDLDPDLAGVSETDIENFIKVVNDGLPGLNLTRKDVLHFYAGLRPLVDTNPNDDSNPDSYSASRASEVFDHATDNIEGLLSAIGGKWTTSRHMAAQVVDLAARKTGRKVPRTRTQATPLYGGNMARYRTFLEDALERHATHDNTIITNLVSLYGSRFEDILATADAAPDPALLHQGLDNTHPDIGAQVVHAVRHEMALHLSDFVMRRSGLGTLGHPGHGALHRTANLMAQERGWDENETARQITETGKIFQTRTQEPS